MKRIRLTKRHAADDTTPYSGDVGNADRKDPKSNAYSIDTYEVPGWELQEEGDPAANDKRLENHVPVMTEDERAGKKASETIIRVRQAASKAVKLAVLFLGDKVKQSVIEAQAKDFMRLGSSSLNNALKRYAATEILYAEDEEEDTEDDTEEIIKSEDESEAPTDEDEDDTEEVEKPSETEESASRKAKSRKRQISKKAEMDVELTAPEDEVTLSEDENKELSNLYAEDEEDTETEQPVVKKAGIKKLGGQPKVASSGREFDLSTLWATDPDVSKVFG